MLTTLLEFILFFILVVVLVMLLKSDKKVEHISGVQSVQGGDETVVPVPDEELVEDHVEGEDHAEGEFEGKAEGNAERWRTRLMKQRSHHKPGPRKFKL
jgi:hypothetical protein